MFLGQGDSCLMLKLPFLFVAESAVRAIREALKCRGRQSDGMRDNSTY